MDSTTLQSLVLFILIGTGIVACIADYITTVKGLAEGFKEANPINKFLFSKLGQPLTAFLEIAAFISVATLMAASSVEAAIGFAAAITVEEAIMAIRNARLKPTTAVAKKTLVK